MDDLILVLLGASFTGMWAVGERSLRKTLEENYKRACDDAHYWRSCYRLNLPLPPPPKVKRKPKSKKS